MMKHNRLLTVASLVASITLTGCQKELPGPLIPTMSAGEVSETGEQFVRNETNEPFRLYY